jgi:tungstate transport system ATP-binding protein
MTAEPLFSLREVSFAYDARPVLRLKELEFAEGQTHVVAGDNGSGKTTLMKLLNGLLQAQAGQVLYRGRPLGADGLPTLRRESVLVHQDPYLFDGTVFHNLAFGLRIRRVHPPELRRRVEQSLEEVGLGGFAHRRARGLSGGEKQRVAIARALVLAPRVLLLDEPTANVDGASLALLEALIARQSSRGTTVILSSHNQAFACRVGTRLVFLEAGGLAPARYNVFKGTVERTDESFTLFRTGGRLLHCPAQEGDFTTALLPLDDVILSREAIWTSAQNQFPGRVLATARDGPVVRVRLDCGFALALEAAITEYSVKSLGVVPGESFYVTFKASALRLY